MGIWKWVQEKASSIYTGITNVVTAAEQFIEIAGDILSTAAYRKAFSNWFIQSWQGFARVLDPSIVVSLLARPQSGRVWMRGEATALARLIPVVIYHGAVRPGLGSGVRAVTNNGVAEFVVVGTVDLIAAYAFTCWAISGAYDNAACGMAMVKASTQESTIDTPSENPLVKSCEHDDIAKLTAGFNRTIYYYGNRVALLGLSRLLPYGDYLSLPLQALFYGWTFLEYPISAAGHCNEHGLQVLRKNNPYAFGFGTSYLAAHRVLKWLIERYIATNGGVMDGVFGFFMDEALSSMLSLHFIMVANLSRNIPLPGAELGVDPFYYGRVATDFCVHKALKQIENKYQGQEESDWYADFKKYLGDKWDLPAVRGLRYALLYDNLTDTKKLAQRPTTRMYLELCGADIEAGLLAVINMRDDSYYQVVDYFKNVMPNVMGERRKALSIVMDKYLAVPLQEWLSFIRDVRDPAFGTTNQKEGLYAAVRAPNPDLKDRFKPKVEIMPDEVEVISVAQKPDVKDLYGVVRKRFGAAGEPKLLGGKVVRAPLSVGEESSASPSIYGNK